MRPLVSHWRMQEQRSGRHGLGQVQYVFVELPKLPLDRPPGDLNEEWAYVFRRAPQLRDVPAHVRHDGPRRALDAARTAWFSAEEWERLRPRVRRPPGRPRRALVRGAAGA